MEHIGKIEKSWWKMIILSSLPFLIVLGHILFAGRVFIGSDLVSSIYPNYYFYQSSLINGRNFFWNPNGLSGFPTFISAMGFLSPVFYIFFRFLPFLAANNLIIFLNLTLALFFTWRLLMKFGVSSWAGFAGGLIYVFSQWQFAPDILLSTALFILPLLFLIIWNIKEKNSNLLIFLGGLIIGYACLSTHFNWLAIILSAGFLFSLFVGWSDSKKWLVPFKFLLSCLLGAFIGLSIILPLLRYSSLSARYALGLSYKEAAVGGLGLGDFLRYFMPYFRLSIFNLAVSPAQLYLGIIPLFFLFFALKIKSPFVRFFTFLFFLCLLISINHSPVFWILHRLPVFDSFREPQRWMFVGSFSAAILAGFGIHYFYAEGWNRDRWTEVLLKILKLIGWFILGVSLIFNLIFYFFRDKFISLSNSYFDKYLYGKTSGLAIDYYHKYIEGLILQTEKLFNLLSPKVFLPIAFIFIGYFILNGFYKKKIRPDYFLGIVVIFIFLNFSSVLAFYHTTIPSEIFFRHPLVVKFLEENINREGFDQTERFFSFMPGFSEYNKLTIPYQSNKVESFMFQSEMISPDLNVFYGLKSVDDYENLTSRRMSRILALIGSDRATIGDKLSNLDIPFGEKVKKLEERKKFLDFLCVRYIISVFPLNEQKFSKVFEAVIPPYDIPIGVYENREARSLVYFADNVDVIGFDEEVVYKKLLLSPLENNDIFIECSDCPEYLSHKGEGDIIFKREDNNLINISVNSHNSQIVVFSESHLPGWKAYLDSEEVPIYTVNSIYMGVLIPAGRHKIIFKYNPYKP